MPMAARSSSSVRVTPLERSTARVNTLFSSRTFPGQSYASIRRKAASSISADVSVQLDVQSRKDVPDQEAASLTAVRATAGRKWSRDGKPVI